MNTNINATNYTVNSGDYYYSPQSFSINVGDTVNWINDGGYHNVNFDISTLTGNSFNNPISFISSPTSNITMYTHVFTLPGTYSYDCSVGQHAANGMTGIIVVNTITTSDLLITEITDPQNSSDAGRYVEIYNSGTQDIDLSTGYALVRWTNASPSPQSSVGLTGILQAGGFYVACNSGTKFLATYGFPASQNIGTGGPADSNGDDNIALLAPDGSIIDMFGLAGEDGSGTGHEFEDGRAERACSSTLPTANWLASDWNIDNDSGGGDGPQYAPADFDPFSWICIATNVSGCTDTSAVNYTANATTDDGSCCFVSGCTDSLAFNYDATVCYDDGSCIGLELGCTDILAMNFDSTANTDDGSCLLLADKVDLFFSEYGEGNSNNKYLEIYNSTSNPVDLSSYGITRVSNAPTTVGVYEYWVDFDSGAVILANDVYIVAHPSADSIILAQADMTYSILSNGDDGFALVYGSKPLSAVLPGNEYVILDFLGDFNGDPGSGWDVAGISEATKDHVLVRKCSVNLGNTDWISSAGTDSLSSEWLVLANEDWNDINQHSGFCGCTDPLAANYNSLAIVDDSSCVYCNAIDTLIVISCDSYYWQLNSTNYYSSGTFWVISTNSFGCIDTTILNLTIIPSTTSTSSSTSCDDYNWNGQAYSATGTYTFATTNSNGCDSVATLELAINDSYASTDTQVHCDTYTWIDGITYTASNSTASYMFQTLAGCDSLSNLELTINSYLGTIYKWICEGDSIIVGSNIYYNTGSYIDSLFSLDGCDSVVFTVLDFYQSPPLFIQTSPDPPEICIGETILLEGSAGFSYYWWDNGSTGNSLVDDPILDTWYLLSAKDSNDCVVKEDIWVFSDSCITGMNDLNLTREIQLYPNPASEQITIDFTAKATNLKVYNILGELISEEKILVGQYRVDIDVKVWKSAIYSVQLCNKDRVIAHKVFNVAR